MEGPLCLFEETATASPILTCIKGDHKERGFGLELMVLRRMSISQDLKLMLEVTRFMLVNLTTVNFMG
jgi:hypothetical protein